MPATRTTTTIHPGARPLPSEVRETLYQELVALSIELDELPEGSWGRRIDIRERQAQVRRLLMDDAEALSASDDSGLLDDHDDPGQHEPDPIVLRDPEPRVLR